jgi:glycosyltransferase involved in cell wall biosynthesis
MIRSLFEQRGFAVEIVVVDDGSQDDTFHVVQQLQQEAAWTQIDLHYYKQSNKGASAARNHGLKNTTGDFILFADSDDLILYDGIEAGLEALIRGDLDYVYLPIWKAETCGDHRLETQLGYTYDGSEAKLLDYHWHTMGIIYKRAFLDKVGGWNELIRSSDDWEFQVRVKLCNGSSCFVDVPIGIWNLHAGPRLSANNYDPNYVDDVLTVCLSIQSHCELVGRFSDAVKIRLFRRLTRHALEAGTHGDTIMRSRILEASAPLAIGRLNRCFQIWLELVSVLPADLLAYRMINRIYS